MSLSNLPPDLPVWGKLEGVYDGRLYDVYDGDSPTLILSVRGELFKVHTRLLGIDAPEMTGLSRREGVRARNRVLQLLTQLDNNDNEEEAYPGDLLTREQIRRRCLNCHTIFKVTCKGNEKYGRVLVRITLADGRDLADILVREGLANEWV